MTAPRPPHLGPGDNPEVSRLDSPGEAAVRRRERSGLGHPALWAFLTVLGLLAVSRAAAQWPIPLPVCLLRKLTGIPCPFCGSTRAAMAVARFDLPGAVALNPLAVLLGLGVGLWFAVWGLERVLGRPVLRNFQRGLVTLPWWWIGGALALLNWIYLLVWQRPG